MSPRREERNEKSALSIISNIFTGQYSLWNYSLTLLQFYIKCYGFNFCIQQYSKDGKSKSKYVANYWFWKIYQRYKSMHIFVGVKWTYKEVLKCYWPGQEALQKMKEKKFPVRSQTNKIIHTIGKQTDSNINMIFSYVKSSAEIWKITNLLNVFNL